MNSKEFFKGRIVILDGGMGTMLQAAGLGLGQRPEVFGLENPEIVEEIHRKYINAGSNVAYANTFGANSHTMKGQKYSVEEVIEANIASAKKAVRDCKKEDEVMVALDIGPLGMLMEPLGPLSFEEAYEIFSRTAIAGEKAGADLAVIETMSDLGEARAALLAVKENTSLDAWVTMSFEANGRTFTGTGVASMAMTLEGLGADAIGINCSLGPEEIYPLIKELAQWTELPLIVKPNAGLPDPATGAYSMDAADFADQMRVYSDAGVSCMGGCCGTDPDFIKELSEMVKKDASFLSGERPKKRSGICSARQVCEFKGVNVIGERINPTGKKRLQQALKDGDMDYIMKQAIEQQEAGADILDINVGLPGIDEAKMMAGVVKAVQSVVSLPLQIDSTEPQAIEAGLRACCGKAIVNSVNGEKERLCAILPIVKKYGAAVVGLTIDEDGIPKTVEKRLEIARKILDECQKYGISKDDIAIDCLTLTISAEQGQALKTLEAARRVRDELGLHGVLGISNISFGLPERTNITTNFLALAMNSGVDLPIINPNSQPIMDTVFSYRAISGEDASCLKYIERFADRPKMISVPAGEKKGEGRSQPGSPAGSEMTLESAILKGLGKETADQVRILLETMNEMDIINGRLIPALDIVGMKYEKQEIFLPQLINAANAACDGFEIIKERIAKRGGENVNKGTIILATVEGDIHDIGKNIVKVVLENYGYKIMDLGKDVPVQTIADAAKENDIKLVGLSALMTTTVESMRKTIEAIRESGHECSVMVGGAVLTPEYAKQIGADYYAKDAKDSADIAKKVFG